jgi:uncharacterized protein
MDKLGKLNCILDDIGSCLLAFSGGTDSSFLLQVAHRRLGGNLLAVTADSPTYPAQELIFSKELAKKIGARHRVIRTGELKQRNFYSNPKERCYYCKKELFGRLKKMARRLKIKHVIDASNITDKEDFRPGERAKKELGIRSPLVEAGFSKQDIRRYSKAMGLATWDKPNLACLASRIPYGRMITPELLSRIGRGEEFLQGLGLRQVRIRDYGDLCRIEVPVSQISRLIRRRVLVVERLRKLGYNYITVDLQGYRTGSMNQIRR